MHCGLSLSDTDWRSQRNISRLVSHLFWSLFKSYDETWVGTDLFFCIVIYIWVKWITPPQKIVGQGLVQFIHYWLDRPVLNAIYGEVWYVSRMRWYEMETHPIYLLTAQSIVNDSSMQVFLSFDLLICNTGIFVVVVNTLYGSKLSIFLVCQKSLGYQVLNMWCYNIQSSLNYRNLVACLIKTLEETPVLCSLLFRWSEESQIFSSWHDMQFTNSYGAGLPWWTWCTG